jgi:hypothetical protein
MKRNKQGKFPAAERTRRNRPAAESRPGTGRTAASGQEPGSRAGASSTRAAGGKCPNHR